MSNYPNAIDDASSFYSPADAFSAKPLETITTMPVYAGDTTIGVESTGVGFPDEYGILSVDDELIVYTSKTATQFTGCQRGAFGTVAAQHTAGATVRANMVSAYIKALQEAVIAIEQELGTASNRNYVRRDGPVTMTGAKTFVDGAEFGSGTKAATGLVRLPNTGAVKWRKADGSGDLGLALNANDRLVADAIIDFAPGQTFGAFSYPDAGYGNKGIVQIDAAGGLAVESGVLSMAPTGASPGTYPKVTIDATGRVTSGANLGAGDLPGHTHTAADIVSGELPHKVQKDGADVGTRRALNLVQGTRVSLAASDDPAIAEPNLLICETCLDTGTRISEVTALMVKHVDLDRGTIQIAQRSWHGDIDEPKTEKSKRTLALGALTPRYRAWIEKLPNKGPNAWVFPQADDPKQPRWDSGVRGALKDAAKLEGLDFTGFGPHSLRRANITWRQEVGGSSIETSKIAGHASTRITEEYTVVQLKRQDELTRRIQDKRAKAAKRQKASKLAAAD